MDADFRFFILRLFLRTAVSHFATAGSPFLPARWAAPHALSKSSASLADPLREMLLSRYGLPWSGTSKSRTALVDSLWRGPEKETARVPPSLDSPLSAAPETFLSRDAVSAFPIAFGTLPQPLPGAPYLGSVALLQSPLRFFWNRAHPLPSRANRQVLSLATDSQSHPRSVLLRPRLLPFACSADQPLGTKTPVPAGQAACSKPPSRPRPRPPSESPTRVRPPQSLRTATKRNSLSTRTSSNAPARSAAPVRPGPG